MIRQIIVRQQFFGSINLKLLYGHSVLHEHEACEITQHNTILSIENASKHGKDTKVIIFSNGISHIQFDFSAHAAFHRQYIFSAHEL